MRREAKTYLYDIAHAVELIASFTADKTFDHFAGDAMLRAAVEREFEIVGEALSQLAHVDDSVVSRISEYRRIIAFRNILAHAYARIDDRIVWDIVESKLSTLRREVASLLQKE
ncbi:MAG: HepT-like ribonuclease domain-containing protein [Chloroflexota bacterium]